MSTVHVPWLHFDGPEAPQPMRLDPDGRKACHPGEPVDPGRRCQRHHEHHYCESCDGWYGVPHDTIHGQVTWQTAHPGRDSDQCACRVCRTFRAMSFDDRTAVYAALDREG